MVAFRRKGMNAKDALSLFEGTYRGTATLRAGYSFLLPRGDKERVLRERGWTLFHFESASSAEFRGVEKGEREFWKEGKKYILRRLLTPLGQITELSVIDPTYGSRWVKEFFVKEPGDYKILMYVLENTFFYPVFDTLRISEENLGEDGLVFVHVERSPFQRLLLDLVGPERLFIDLVERPDLVEEVLALLGKKSEEEYAIAASSPLRVVHVWDNITEDMTTPRFFEQYCLPFYQHVAEILHQKGKLFAVHMDGKLKHLQELIGEAPIDVIESFTLPGAGGNLELREAQQKWPGKSIIANVPAYWCFQEEEAVKRHLFSALQGVDRSRFMFCVSEDLPPFRMWPALTSITDILESWEREE
jgi:hypothetical protein